MLRYLVVAVAMLAAGIADAGSKAAEAQTFPSKPITIYWPLGPGTPQEAILRAMAELVAKDVGQPVLIDIRPGGGGVVAYGQLVQAGKSDGYTLAGVFSPIVLVSQMEKVGFDPATDITYLMQFASFPVGVAIKADSPHKSWADVIAFAKANPTKVTFGTPGPASFAQLAMESILQKADVKMTHVPYKGPMPIIQAVMSGEVVLQVSGMEWKPQVEAGGMRLLAMLTAKPHPSFPTAPAISELGDLKVALGLAGPKDLDPAIARRLHDAFKKASEDPAIRAMFQRYDFDYHYASGDDFKKSLLEIGTRLRPVIEKLGLLAK